MVIYMREQRKVSIRQRCKTVGMPRSSYRYKRKSKDDQPIIDELLATGKHPAIGFCHCYYRLRAKGRPWKHKRVYRVYTALRLNIRCRAKKRLPVRAKPQLFQPKGPNQVWSLDFMHDSPWDARTFRMLNMIDDYNSQVPWIETDTSLPAQHVIRVLENLKASRGLPGKPTQNAYVERFDGSIRSELLNAYIFKTLSEVREKPQQWKYNYNHNRPHKSLEYKTPVELLP